VRGVAHARLDPRAGQRVVDRPPEQPVLSIAASVTPSSVSQPAIFCSCRQNVRKLLVITLRSPGLSPGSRTATQMIFLCTSIPATRG